MSFGKNKSESSQQFDPQLKAALMSVFGEGQRLYNDLGFQPYQGATIAPMSPFQQEGLNQTLTNARGQIGNDQLNAAKTALTGVTNFTPDTLTSQQIGGVPQVGTSQVGTSQVSNIPQIFSDQINNVGQVAGQNINPMALLGSDQVNAERFSNTNLNPYLNQYEDQVVNQTIGDIDRARQMQQNQNNAAAVSAGAFGGDRQAIQRAETDRNALETTARQVGQLRQGGYESAAQRAEGDISRNLTGQQSNQASNSQTGQFNIGNEFNRQQANQARDLTQSQANAANSLARQRANQSSNLAARTSNAGNNLIGQRANQSANLQSSQANASNTLNSSTTNAANNLAMQRANQADSMQAGIGNQNAGLQNQNLQLAAANQLTGVGEDYRNFANQDAQNILGVGNFQQGQAQNILDDQGRRYQEEQEYPFRMFDLLRGAAGLLPGGTVGSSSGSGWKAGLV
jgi:hypothetical protein